MPSLAPDYKLYDKETSRLLELRDALTSLDPYIQKLVAEIILLRLFSLFENLVSVIPTKLVAGAHFVDKTLPKVAVSASTLRGAEALLHDHGRQKPQYQLHWSKVSDIKANVKYVMDPTDNYVTSIDRHRTFIDEIRCVRNRIAHNSSQSRKYYKEVVRIHYGAYRNNVAPGTLLLTTRFTPCLLVEYIKTSRILGKDLVKAK